ncbi:PiggyBac transposable element-derived protein 4 [Plakobranchus ocellatus]|uniref:PiggyBac transposable element-derived protein 4 n=1 Tax=Plakobranchus ocellatus TaxID=259542 RepID=A0AAV3ZL25_9GAST|nr:PiggyBac transposable element-derived protein 4 [Plakobranchus ocellatus]
MSGVDHSDQLISFFPMRRKSQKWWKKPFFHLLTLVSIQTTILLNKHRRQHGRRVTTLSSVVKELIVSLAGTDLTIDAIEDTVNLPLARLHERHFIKLCPPTGEPGKARRQCKVCTDKAKKAGATHEERKNKRK